MHCSETSLLRSPLQMGHINRKVTLNIDEATFAGKTYINQGKQCLFATITIIMTINLD